MSNARPSAGTSRRRRRRARAEFAGRSPLHAFIVWLLRSGLVALLFLAVWLLVVNWAVPSLIEGLRP